MREQRLYLNDILESINLIQSYVFKGKEEFLNTRLIQDAVIRNLEVIGEATKKLSPEIKASHSSIPWRQIAGLRDVLIHNYMKVDPDEIWGVVENNLDDLKKEVELILQELD
ncbi:DUF86 domain-containing protein [Gloeocapsa sp. PCC 73106]|uniref:HepT-like ribonuclease domain-containing protein n=1 Tax=Gloeocapsa sp. PCC 73106 TaxID=102232 RepID=UPI0002ACE034|nr:DUF86 domain-containing protein [Gloeocapsa sp. PCC 73106]ELR98487.1 hypothetical protein GLO73106DRAFT_00023200 [Gloeocapsa sp. PCC 73106]